MNAALGVLFVPDFFPELLRADDFFADDFLPADFEEDFFAPLFFLAAIASPVVDRADDFTPTLQSRHASKV
jgi:hypothetical protein